MQKGICSSWLLMTLLSVMSSNLRLGSLVFLYFTKMCNRTVKFLLSEEPRFHWNRLFSTLEFTQKAGMLLSFLQISV